MNKIIFLFFTLLVGCVNNKKFIKSPFGKLDTLSTNDWWNRSDNPIVDLKVDRDDVIAFGIYTVSNKILKLTLNDYQEVKIKKITANKNSRLSGIHHFDQGNGKIYVDKLFKF